MLYVARILYPVKVLGPGNRVGIWFAGCKHKCKGCSNPELWDLDDKYRITIDSLIELITKIAESNQIDGITITGGDPMEQANELRLLLGRLTSFTKDILIYSGYTINEIRESFDGILDNIAVLIDGKYEEDKNKGELLRGSTNQSIIILKEEFKEKYCDYLSTEKSSIQNFYLNNSAISVGIHLPGYERELNSKLEKKGLVAYE